MTHFKLITTLLAGAAVGLSQTPPARPAPPAPPAQEAMPAPTPMPRPAAAPAPMPRPRAIYVGDLDNVITPEIEAQIEAARDQVINLRDLNIDREEIRAQVEAAREQIRAMEPQLAYARSLGQGFAFAPQITPMPPMPPMPARTATAPVRVNISGDRAYSAGQSALDSRHWDDAVTYFNQVISRGTTRIDGALYWKAYALARLGRSSESLAAIAELRKSYGSSRWMDDAKALEIEVNQAAGKPISPDAETDDDLKLLALEALSHSDAERAFPALEKILKASSSSPKLKRNALYVLADNKSPKAQSLLEQIARGGANPDLQVKAINYMPRNANSGQILAEIYTASNDSEVKRAVLNALVGARDKDRLLTILKSEKSWDLRGTTINYLGGINGNAELWQLYQTETTTEGKEQILSHMYNNGNPDKLLELLRTEKEPKLRVQAARVLGSYRTTQVLDGLVAAYPNEQDAQVKQAIIDGVYGQRNGKAMVDLAKAEKDPKLKIRLVERLGNIKNCKECSDYLLEILNR